MGVTRRGDGIAEPPRQPPQQDHLSHHAASTFARNRGGGRGSGKFLLGAPLQNRLRTRVQQTQKPLERFFSPRRADLAPLRASQRFGFEGRGRSPRLDSSARRAKGRDIWDGRAQNPRCYPKFKLFARASAAHTRAQHDVRHGTRRHHAQDDGGSRERRDDGSHVDFPNAERTHERVERGDPIERERRTKRGCFEVRRVRADRRGTRRDAVARAVPALPAPRVRRDRLRALTPDPPSRARSPQTPPRRPPSLSLAPSTMTCQRC